MFKVLIVEDEPKTLQGIAGLVREHSREWQIVGLCEDGLQALDAIAAERPDLIITDLMMPHMNGLAFIERVKREKPDIEFVILSGHGVFEFAKQAIKNRVLHYLLKPLDEEEFTAVMDCAKEEISKRRTASERPDSAIPDPGGSELRDLLFNDLLSENPSLQVVQRIGREIACLGNDCRCIAMVHYPADEGAGDMTVGNDDRTQSLIRSLLERLGEERAASVYVFRHRNGSWAILVGENGDGAAEAIAGNARGRLAEAGVAAYFGISGVFAGAERLRHASGQAYSAAKRHLYEPERTVFVHEDEAPDAPGEGRSLPSCAHKLITCIRVGNAAEAAEQARTWARWIGVTRPDIYTLERMLERWCANMGEQTGGASLPGSGCDAIRGALLPVRRFRTIEALCRRLESVAAQLADEAKRALNQRTGKTIGRILHYIHANYAKDLSLDELADRIGLNPSYLSNYFKTSTGINFLEYLTRLRIDNAKELLLQTNLKTFEIAQLVGYSDPKYFARTFKKATGVIPSEYRKHSG